MKDLNKLSILNARTHNEITNDLTVIEKHFKEKSKIAREVAKKAYKKGDKKKWQKYCAVSRVWDIAAHSLYVYTLPF